MCSAAASYWTRCSSSTCTCWQATPTHSGKYTGSTLACGFMAQVWVFLFHSLHPAAPTHANILVPSLRCTVRRFVPPEDQPQQLLELEAEARLLSTSQQLAQAGPVQVKRGGEGCGERFLFLGWGVGKRSRCAQELVMQVRRVAIRVACTWDRNAAALCVPAIDSGRRCPGKRAGGKERGRSFVLAQGCVMQAARRRARTYTLPPHPYHFPPLHLTWVWCLLPQVDAGELASTLSRLYFGRMVAVNEVRCSTDGYGLVTCSTPRVASA